MLKIPALEHLIHELSKLPGIGPKSAQRLSYFVLKSPQFATDLVNALRYVEEKVSLCKQCFSFTDLPELCHFCNHPERMDDILCVVEEPADIAGIEASGAFRGRYHVLHGVISPLEGVHPKDLRIQELLERINKSESPIQEIILALDADLEGDTTVLYLTKLLSEKQIKITRIAHGVPIGGDIDYIDNRTLNKALANRVEL